MQTHVQTVIKHAREIYMFFVKFVKWFCVLLEVARASPSQVFLLVAWGPKGQPQDPNWRHGPRGPRPWAQGPRACRTMGPGTHGSMGQGPRGPAQWTRRQVRVQADPWDFKIHVTIIQKAHKTFNFLCMFLHISPVCFLVCFLMFVDVLLQVICMSFAGFPLVVNKQIVFP